LRVKICGVTNRDDAAKAVALGADALGLNFYPKSPRCIGHDQAKEILRALPLCTQAIGVFVNKPLRELVPRMEALGRCHGIQWHGENPEVSDVYPYHFIPAFSVKDAGSLNAIEQYLDLCRKAGSLPSAILVDAHVAGEYGGTGRTAPWQLLAEFR